jgi:threonyl-tRNA synthetase
VQDKHQLPGMRCEIDVRSEKIGYKIREAELKKTLHGIIGQKKQQRGNLTLPVIPR